MRCLKDKIYVIIFVTCAISFITCQEPEEGSGVCEVLEGSTCDAETYCCKPSICNEKEPSTKCCNDTLLSIRPPPSDCSMCPICKEDEEKQHEEGRGDVRQDEEGESLGFAISLIVVAVVSIVAILFVLLCYVLKRRRNRGDPKAEKHTEEGEANKQTII